MMEGKEKEESMKGILDKHEDINKAHKEFKKFTSDEKMRELYEARLKQKRDYSSNLKQAIKEGKIEVAKNMLAEGELIEKISKYTGLSLADIEKLK